MQRRQTEIIAGTDSNLIGEIESQYYDVLRILIDPELEPLKSRITMLYTSLTQHLESQEAHIRKCKMSKGDYDDFLSRIASCNKVISQETQQAENIKKDLRKLNTETEELKRKEAEIHENIMRHKLQANILEKESIKGLEEIEIRNENQQNELKKRLDEQLKIKEQLQSKHVSLMDQQKFGIEEISELQRNNSEITTRIDDLRELIKEIQVRDSREKRNNDQKKEELNRAKLDKDTFKEARMHLVAKVAELDKDIAQTAETLKQSKKDKDEEHRTKLKLEKLKEEKEKEYSKKLQEIQKLLSSYAEREGELKEKELEYHEILNERSVLEIELQQVALKVMGIKTENEDLARSKAECLAQRQIQTEQLEKVQRERERKRAALNQMSAKRMEKDKFCKIQEADERAQDLENVEELNKLKKIRNQVTSYELEHEKLARVLDQIKSQQQKYGIEASHAHSKYFQTLEELKAHNAQIQSLQRDNQEVENKCKYQQNLYEAVRSDRNLYSKDFLKFKDEISELKKKYKRMTYAVDQLREEIKNKDQELVELDKDFKKVQSENVRIEADKNRALTQIQANEEVIKNQESHVGHLKKIIQEAKQQKAKQQKDYDMVRNERDILGTQLIKRNQQLALLYEKIKLSNSNLMKGETYGKERERELSSLKMRLATLRNEFLSIDDQIRCIEELRGEISFKQKELLNQKAKIKALEDELQNPMNVHRWRKLEATDQENYERILKIQTLQRRLIAKTEEVQSKEQLIREKEKLFLELKNILARQPGSEIHDQLVKYKEALKEKTGQMKKMKKQLENAHEEMGSVKFEVDRIQSEMTRMKDEYFQLREASEKEVLDERNFAQQLMSLNVNTGQKTLGQIGITALKK